MNVQESKKLTLETVSKHFKESLYWNVICAAHNFS